MKTNQYLFILFFLVFLFLLPTVKAQRTFVHPGGLHTIEDLERVKAKVLAGETPWKEAWQLVLNDPSSRNTYVASPREEIGTPNRQQADRDFYAAYLNILRWYITGDESHAQCAVRICNAWANTVKTASGELYQIPIAGAVLTAELLRGTYSGWQAEDIKKFQAMARNIFYPPCSNFLGTCAHPSWDVQAAASVMAIGVFCDDEEIYNEAVQHFRSKDGYGSIRVAMDEETGQGFEMGRDQPHAALANGSLAQMCQIGWNQGDDLYSFADNLLLRGFDYYCKYNLNHAVEWEPVRWCRAPGNSSWFHVSTHDASNRIRSSAVYEMVYNHYIVKKGIDASKAPYLVALTNLARPEQGEGGIYLGHGTLMYTLDASKSPLRPYPTPPAPTQLKAIPGINCIHLSWASPDGDVASGYEIYRATGSSNSFTKIGGWVDNTRTKYTDNSVTIGNTYKYYVKASNQSGLGVASDIATAEAIATEPELPLGWGYTAVGAAIKGSAEYLNSGINTFTLSGGGSDMGGTSDGHGFAFTKITGDATIYARLYNATWPSGGTKIGLVMRESLSAVSKRVTLNIGEQGARHSRFGVRTGNGGNTSWHEGNDFTYLPIWFKIERSGNVFSAYQSIDGVDWYKFASETVDMASSCYVGLSASAGTSTGELATAQFDNVTVINNEGSIPSLPATFQGTAANSTTINLTWSAPSGAATYSLKRSESEEGPFTTIAQQISETGFKDTDLKPDTEYYYSLTSANLHGESEASVIKVKTRGLSIPPKPAGVKVTSNGNTYVGLQWNVTEEQPQYYNIKRAAKSIGPYETIGTSSTNTYLDLDVLNGTTYYYVISAVNAIGEGINSNWTVGLPTVGNSYYWSLNEENGSTETVDAWNNKKMSVPATARWQAGKFNNSVQLNSTASADYLSLSESVTSNLNNFTISLWVNLISDASWARVFDFGTGTSRNMFLTCRSGSGFLRYAIKNGSAEQQINTTTNITVGEWTHIVVTQEGSTGIVYVNGVEVGRNASLSINPSNLGNTTLNYFGKSMYSADPYFKGSLDEIRIYDKALAPELIKELFESKAQEIQFDDLPTKKVGDSAFKPTASATSGLGLSFASSNTNIAEIVNGEIHIKTSGTVDITAHQAGSIKYAAAPPVTQPFVINDATGIDYATSTVFSVYPNPATDYLYITNEDDYASLNIRIYSLEGKMLLENKNYTSGKPVNVSHLSDGIYMLKADDGKKYITKKIIVFR